MNQIEFRKMDFSPLLNRFFLERNYDDVPFLRYGFFSKIISNQLKITSVYKIRKIFMKLIDDEIIIKKNIKKVVHYKVKSYKNNSGQFIVHF